MEDLTLCIYDELVAEGSEEHKMLQSVLNGKDKIKLFGVDYAIVHVEVQKYNGIDKYLKGAMDKTIIKAKRLVTVNLAANVKAFAD